MNSDKLRDYLFWIFMFLASMVYLTSYIKDLQRKQNHPATYDIKDLIITNSFGQPYQVFILGDDIEIEPIFNIGTSNK